MVERQNISVFENIAQKTGGSTHYTNSAGLKKIIVEDIKVIILQNEHYLQQINTIENVR